MWSSTFLCDLDTGAFWHVNVKLIWTVCFAPAHKLTSSPFKAKNSGQLTNFISLHTQISCTYNTWPTPSTPHLIPVPTENPKYKYKKAPVRTNKLNGWHQTAHSTIFCFISTWVFPVFISSIQFLFRYQLLKNNNNNTEMRKTVWKHYIATLKGDSVVLQCAIISELKMQNN